jgi:hypothetical protein
VPGVTLPKSPPVWRRPRIKRRDTFTAAPIMEPKGERGESAQAGPNIGASRPQHRHAPRPDRKHRRADHSANYLNRQELQRLLGR